ENYVHALLSAELKIAGQISRIAGEVFSGTKLGGINIDADDEFAALANGFAGAAHEAQVAGVKIAHGGNQPDQVGLPAPCSGKALHCCYRTNYAHVRDPKCVAPRERPSTKNLGNNS